MKFEDIKERKFYFLFPRITYVLQKESNGIYVFFYFLKKSSLGSYFHLLSKEEYERSKRAWVKIFKKTLDNPLEVIDKKHFFDSIFKNRGK